MTADRLKPALQDCVRAMQWWASQEDGIPEEAWAAYSNAKMLLGEAFDGSVQPPTTPEPSDAATYGAIFDADTETPEFKREADDLMAEGYREAAATNGFQDSPSEAVEEAYDWQDDLDALAMATSSLYQAPPYNRLRAHITAQDEMIAGHKERIAHEVAKVKRLRAEIERLTERQYPSSCGEGCDACPVPTTCPLDNELRDCVSDRLKADRDAVRVETETELTTLRQQAERDAAALRNANATIAAMARRYGVPEAHDGECDCHTCEDARAALSTREEATP